jgi:O-antigen/teichoic acid export membrane protein
VVWFIPIATQFVMVQSTSAYWVNGQREAIAALLNRLIRYIVLSTAFLLLIIGVFAEAILQSYFGEAFVAASLAVRLMTFGVLGFSIVRIVMPVIQARGNLRPLILAMATATLTDIALNIWLTPRWGAAGAAAASSVSYTVATIF